MNTAWLTYYFQGFKFRFVRDELRVIDLEHRREWRVSFSRDREMPFQIQLLDADCDEQ